MTPCVVGINLGHDDGAALITDTMMVAIGEERLNRTRYSPGWEAALLYCLRAAHFTLADVDLVAVRGISRTSPTRTETGLAHLGIDPAGSSRSTTTSSTPTPPTASARTRRRPCWSSTAAATTTTPGPPPIHSSYCWSSRCAR
jgi:predicted NodU family carbamoyl transferase